ncbi:Cyclic di-GMP phosphodiesterase response regulator RpfG [Rosistilla carotiformis]|uniref:Cyclic di-GMP phosphodiesterase response regulator RpfG n=1 Tax=Rosistilla carotiformis TaxID=2528017 RepID=A0A518JN99_9BACT|nr:HD domain-containing phosphohydrolase [Rosistilla carotiformis]QDV67029.1 Cyclic di-GMP phosphodiesterase response regulator RpfG [Rosistilla carotiformis]
MPLDFGRLGVGTVLKESLYSDSGMLLLRRGSYISEEVYNRLRRRSTSRTASAPAWGDPYTAKLPGSNGSRHGCKPYDAQQIQRLQDRFESASETVTDLAEAFNQRKLTSDAGLRELAGDYIEEMARDMDQVLSALCEVPEDQRLAARCIRMGMISIAIGIEMDLPKDDLIQLGTAGVMHDWGLFGEPTDLRFIHPAMTLHQRIQYTRHPFHTYDLLRSITNVSNSVVQAVLQTHERLDGSGFPTGLRGDQIQPFARILAVADTYLSLTEPLGDLPSVVPCDAVAYLVGQLGKSRFDPRAVRGFLQAMAQFPIGSLLQLSDFRQVKVLRSNGKQYGRPIVQDLMNSEILDLAKQDLRVVKPILRHDPPEYRLKPEFRRLMDNRDLPEYLHQDCFVRPEAVEA